MREPESIRRWQVTVRVLLFMIGCLVVLATVAPLTETFPAQYRELSTGVIAGVCTFALTGLFVKWDRIGLDRVGAAVERRSVVRFLAGIAIGLVLITSWAGLSWLAGHVHWVRSQNVGGPEAGLALAAYVALACREELAFRGYPLRCLERRFGGAIAQVVIAVVFAFEHQLAGASWSDAWIGAGVGSLLFGAAALATRGLAVPIGVHAAWNFGHWALGLKGSAGIWQPVGSENGPDAYRVAMLLYAIVMLSAALLFVWWQRRSASRA
ncbi:MAG TPA: type II CAAX endopeptidase family protein [Thermoanaerobaculia bacterium]|jgi:membrane protease YdiL (CAAX protease family)|nr:type II CAAX endopeptidase family protein [Thermoanaerobaculia bacterium]